MPDHVPLTEQPGRTPNIAGPTIWSDARQERRSHPSTVSVEADPRGVRSVFQQDYDRILFSSPVRRLADKTQVWPMDANDGVRTRLTHSHEVANLARSIGTRVARADPSSFRGADLHEVVQPMLSAIGLAHDLGNPPFGHQGEAAIGRWFRRRADWIFTREDETGSGLLNATVPENLRTEFNDFDGNPQSLRLLTKLQTSHRHVGLDLSAGTLAASIKYPVHSDSRNDKNLSIKKAGYFESERNVVSWLREKTGLGEGQRHPLTWIMEACDDIAYSVLDVDDLLKKGIISPDDVLVILKHTPAVKDLPSVHKLDAKFREINDDERRAEIRRDIKEQYVRAYMVEALINDASQAYADNGALIARYEMSQPLMEKNPLCCTLKNVAQTYGFTHPQVLRSEALGAAAIDGLMTVFWSAIHNRKKPGDLMSKRNEPRDRYAFSLISPNYLECASRDAGEVAANGRVSRYHELRLLADMISGMTDGFATETWRRMDEVPSAGGS